jgi:hypothetical protein
MYNVYIDRSLCNAQICVGIVPMLNVMQADPGRCRLKSLCSRSVSGGDSDSDSGSARGMA